MLGPSTTEHENSLPTILRPRPRRRTRLFFEDDNEDDSLRSHPCSCGAPQSMKMFKPFPSREGQGPSGPGVGCGVENEPTPALRATPPTEGIFMGVLHTVLRRTCNENISL